jgi:dihydrodipicolinate synthase/N-acetylneuraminate lyase
MAVDAEIPVSYFVIMCSLFSLFLGYLGSFFVSGRKLVSKEDCKECREACKEGVAEKMERIEDRLEEVEKLAKDTHSIVVKISTILSLKGGFLNE